MIKFPSIFLRNEFAIELIPKNQVIIHNFIFPNLEAGIVLAEEKATMLGIADKMLAAHQADALVLGCTELPLIIKEGDLDTVLIDTTQVHIEAILREILS
jgi:aspartate racemase